MSKIVRKDFIKLITCEYFKINKQKELDTFRKKIEKQKNSLKIIYGDKIKKKLDKIFSLMYNQILFELEDIIKFTLCYSLDIKKLISN